MTAARANAIVSERQRAIQAVRREARPKALKELERAKEAVALVLTLDQARLLRSRFEQLRSRRIPFLP
jgi:hypothetical protein